MELPLPVSTCSCLKPQYFCLNCLLIFIIPLGYLAYALKWDNTWIFVLNFSALIPLTKLFEFTTKKVVSRVNQINGAFLSATFGNAIEIIVLIVALIDGKINVAQASILGSIALNLILVLGMCIFLKVDNQLIGTSILLALIGFIVPSSFNVFDNNGQKLFCWPFIIGLSLICLYFYFLTLKNLIRKEREQPKLSFSASFLLLAVVTVATIFSVKYLLGSVEPSGISETTVGFVLPVVNELLNFVTAVPYIIKNKRINPSNSKIEFFIALLLLLLFSLLIIGQEVKLNLNPLSISALTASYLALKHNLQEFKEFKKFN